MPFRPHLDGDLLPQLPLQAACPDVPLIIGTTAHEQRLYVRPRHKISDVELIRYVTRRLATLTTDPETAARTAIAHYQQRTDEPTSNAAVLADIDTELRFRRPAQRYVDARGGNTWVYRFDWPSPAMRGWLGACHAIDVPFVFGNINLPGTDKFVGASAAAETLAIDVMHRWASFARDGQPGDDWPVYDSISRQRLHLGETTSVRSINDDPEVAMWDEGLGTS
jgi:para-nitrobenzyl esterase